MSACSSRTDRVYRTFLKVRPRVIIVSFLHQRKLLGLVDLAVFRRCSQARGLTFFRSRCPRLPSRGNQRRLSIVNLVSECILNVHLTKVDHKTRPNNNCNWSAEPTPHLDVCCLTWLSFHVQNKRMYCVSYRKCEPYNKIDQINCEDSGLCVRKNCRILYRDSHREVGNAVSDNNMRDGPRVPECFVPPSTG